MELVSIFGRSAFAALVCLSLWVWCATPVAGHPPTAVETVQHNPHTVAQDGHAHGFDEDLYRLFLGHGPDAIDHDHGQLMLALGEMSSRTIVDREAWRPGLYPGGPSRIFLIERPPRA